MMPEEEKQQPVSQQEIDNLVRNMGGDEADQAPEPLDAEAEPSQATGDADGPFEFGDVEEQEGRDSKDNIELLMDVDLNVKIELGRTNMLVEDVLRLSEGSVVELDKLAGDPVDILVNDRLIAKGEVVVLNENFCVRIVEILPQEERTSR